MPKIKLSEITNLMPIANRRKKFNQAIFEFIAVLLGEYALNGLEYNETDRQIFPCFSRFFSSGEVASQELLKNERLQSVDELNTLFREFPEVGQDGFFDTTAWNLFMSESEWEETPEGHCLTLNGHEYRMPAKLLALRQGREGNVARRYMQDAGQAVYQDVGTGEDPQPTGFPCLFAVAGATISGAGETRTAFTISEEEFFRLPGAVASADEEQREAIKSDTDKDLVILAGAGSGKTRTLVCRLAYLHLVKGIPLNKILLLTFTRNAADSMKRRSIELMKPIYDQYGLQEDLSVEARTIDSFAIRLLDNYYLQMGFDQKPVKCLDGGEDNEREGLKMLEDIIIQNNMQGVFRFYFDQNTGLPGKNFRWLLDNLTKYARGLPDNSAGFDTLLTLYMNKQREQGRVLGFTEVSLFVKEAMCQPDSPLANAVRNNYSCILFDEFQDIDSLQNSIFEPLNSGDTHFTLVGDDDQSIYYWRGSNNSIIRSFLTKPNISVVYLLRNYRNNPNIVRAGNAVLQTVKDRAKENKPIIPYRQSGEKILISTYDEKYTNLVNEVSRILKYQPPEEICILCRKYNPDGNNITRALKAADIPVAKRQIQIDANDNYKLMRAILNILNGSQLIASTKELRRILEVDDVTELHIQKVVLGDCPEAECEEALKPAKFLGDELRLSPVRDLAEAVCRYSIKAAELFEKVSCEQHSDPVFPAFEDFCKNNDVPWPTPQAQLQELFRTFEDETRKENRQDGPLSGGVKVSTIHAVKGLEYNVVFIIGLTAGEYPSTKPIDDRFRALKNQISTLAESRARYYETQNAVAPETVKQVLLACENPAFSSLEKENLAEFRKELWPMQNKLVSLTADGVDEYLDAYHYYVFPLEHQCNEDICEKAKDLLIQKTEEETLKEEIELLEKEDRDAANARRETLRGIQEEISNTERRIEKLKDRKLRFQKSIADLRKFNSICFIAKGCLSDMAKESEQEELAAQAERDRAQRINEERRLYYVAITRARDYLYLCYAAGTRPSEFIDNINDDLKAEHVMLTLEEEREYRRLSGASHLETDSGREDVDDEKAREYADGLMAVDKFQAHIQENLRTFNTLHPVFQSLSAEAKAYYDRAVGLIAIAELTRDDFKTEFAHNMQRMAEVVLSQYAGSEAQPFKTVDPALAERITNDIREIAENCATAKPSPKYLLNLLTQPDRYPDTLQTLKSAGILHYITRSGKYPISLELLSTWSNAEPLKDAGGFLVAALDLANTRNTLIHTGKDDWTEDVVPQILKNAETLVAACGVEPRPLTKKDIRMGRRVQHKTLGYGIIRTVEDGRFWVEFEDSGDAGAKMFLILSGESSVFYAL